jgi:hypothetical protein
MRNHNRRLRFDAIKARERMLMQYDTLVIKATRGMLFASWCTGDQSNKLWSPT